MCTLFLVYPFRLQSKGGRDMAEKKMGKMGKRGKEKIRKKGEPRLITSQHTHTDDDSDRRRDPRFLGFR